MQTATIMKLRQMSSDAPQIRREVCRSGFVVDLTLTFQQFSAQTVRAVSMYSQRSSVISGSVISNDTASMSTAPVHESDQESPPRQHSTVTEDDLARLKFPSV